MWESDQLVLKVELSCETRHWRGIYPRPCAGPRTSRTHLHLLAKRTGVLLEGAASADGVLHQLLAPLVDVALVDHPVVDAVVLPGPLRMVGSFAGSGQLVAGNEGVLVVGESSNSSARMGEVVLHATDRWMDGRVGRGAPGWP
jgi:hypothetical protein